MVLMSSVAIVFIFSFISIVSLMSPIKHIFSFMLSKHWFSFKCNSACEKPGEPTKSYVCNVSSVTLPFLSTCPLARDDINNGNPPSTIACAIFPFGVFNNVISPETTPFSSILIESIRWEIFSVVIFILCGCSSSPGIGAFFKRVCIDSTILA